ncbi:hypothetical protein RIF29_40918 [Crotalaria pallida]|uniref:Uncharacterized protein n=1 Tax=Crotalaria pallida TaxID=3830 RepID=A0AAN9HNW6_CROPI
MLCYFVLYLVGHIYLFLMSMYSEETRYQNLELQKIMLEVLVHESENRANFNFSAVPWLLKISSCGDD